jgi:hypothetical protein
MKPYPTSEKPSSARASPHVIEAVLNHRSGVIRGVAAVYNRCRYEPEKREALSAWAAHVANLIPAPAIGLPLAA